VNRPLYNVVDHARPHTADDLSVNHGGVAILADAIALSPIDSPCRLFQCESRPAVPARLASTAAAADVL